MPIITTTGKTRNENKNEDLHAQGPGAKCMNTYLYKWIRGQNRVNQRKSP